MKDKTTMTLDSNTKDRFIGLFQRHAKTQDDMLIYLMDEYEKLKQENKELRQEKEELRKENEILADENERLKEKGGA